MFWGRKTVKVRNSFDGHVPDSRATIVVKNRITYIPKVSVIIPVHNAVKYLKRCLNSVINQTLHEIEIICVDDGSTDLSLAMLIEYAKKDNRITVLTQKNMFAGVARNCGLSVARGEYIAFLDSDDAFNINMLKQMYEAAIKNDADIAMCNADAPMVVLDHWFNGETVFSCKEGHIASVLFQCIEGYPWNKLYRKQMVQDKNFYFSNAYIHEDTAFVMPALIAANKIVYIKEEFVHYEQNPNSISKNKTYTKGLYISVVDLYNTIKRLPNFERVKKSYSNRSVGFVMATFFDRTAPIPRQEVRDYIKKFRELKIFDLWEQETHRYATVWALKNIMETIPVVICVDKNTIDDAIKTMNSCIDSTAALIDFYLIISSSIKKSDIKKIKNIQYIKNCGINFIKQKDLELDYLLPNVVLNKYARCIKIDAGIIINQNLCELYVEDMNGWHIAKLSDNNTSIALYNLIEIKKSKNSSKIKRLPMKYNKLLRTGITFVPDLIMLRYEWYSLFYNAYVIPGQEMNLTEEFYQI